ncbi:MAG: hypothetical protein H0U97_11945 [Gammaproteobacteria bacterium]|nr:hypothetical protein [Gammaproteobacteria bacterium]
MRADRVALRELSDQAAVSLSEFARDEVGDGYVHSEVANGANVFVHLRVEGQQDKRRALAGLLAVDTGCQACSNADDSRHENGHSAQRV